MVAKVQAAGNGAFEARLVCITNPDSSETREVIWADAAEQKLTEGLKEQLFNAPFWKEASSRVKQNALVEIIQSLLSTNAGQLDIKAKTEKNIIKI